MKDLLIRVLISAIAGALVSAGILYFAFDQAMRGLETAVETTNSRIGDLKSDVSGVTAAIAEQARMDRSNHKELADRLDAIASGISGSEENLKEAWIASAMMYAQQSKVNSAFLEASINTTDAIRLLGLNSKSDGDVSPKLESLLKHLEETQTRVRILTNRDGSEFWLNVGPISDLSSSEFRSLLQEIESNYRREQ